jgi:xanthine dehydrogenase YagS FAD-binding subunit
MKAFDWVSPKTIADAVRQLQTPKPLEPEVAPQAIAGGQDLLTSMKDRILRPPRLVNLKSIPGLDRIELDSSGALRLGALVTLAQLEEHAEVRKRFPGLTEAVHSIATPQIRNLGTVGGNLCQRPRCWYFRLEEVICLKKGGDECYAESGENKYNAILGGGPSHIVHPSDLAPILVALGAMVTIAGPGGTRTIPLEKFFILPAEDPRRENVLVPGEIITSVQVSPSAVAARSTYLKFKERPSHDFALSAVAAAADLDPNRKVREARLVLGGVAPIPWRVPNAEAFLAGKTLDPDTIAEAAKLALKGATPLPKNGFKVRLTEALVRRALSKLSASQG